jgi:GNAT superfamily N-acetyltransferase
MPIAIDAAREGDLGDMLALYRHLHPGDPEIEAGPFRAQWRSMLASPMLRVLVARDGERAVATCILVIVPNLTRGGRPYGLIENVVTDPGYRRQGVGTRILQHALGIAWDAGCYKVMLLTGRKDEATLRFYEQAGFIAGEKIGFVAKPPRG